MSRVSRAFVNPEKRSASSSQIISMSSLEASGWDSRHKLNDEISVFLQYRAVSLALRMQGRFNEE